MIDWRLFEAAAAGNMDFLTQIDGGPSEFDKLTLQSNNVLHIAVKHKRRDFTAAILSLCPSLLVRTNAKGETPLHIAASVGCFEISELLVTSARQTRFLRATNKQNETALHVAVKNGHIDVAKFLMEEDAELLDMADNGDATPLYSAVVRGFSGIVDHILETSPLASGRGPKGSNALHAAVDCDIDRGVLRKMVQRKPEMIKEADAVGWTPLHYSVWVGDIETTGLFLQHDISTAYVSDKDGKSPLHLAAFVGDVDIFKELVHCCPYIWELIDSKGRTCLHSAVISGCKGIVKCILGMPELAGLVNEPDEEGNTPLHLAVVHERYAITSVLARNKQVDKYAVNNNLLRAIDIFLSKKKEIRFQVAMVYYLLRKSCGRSHDQHYIETFLRKEMNGETKEEQETKPASDEEKESSSMYEVHLLVAVLVATVTFAAVFTMPGGYVTDGPDKGIPILIHHSAFKFFAVFNAVAFCFSVTTVYLLFYASRDGYRTRDYFLFMAVLLLIASLLGMVLAFVSAMCLMLSESRGLAVAPILMVGFFVLLAFCYWFVDPRGMYVPGLERPRLYLRKLLFRNCVFPYSS